MGNISHTYNNSQDPAGQLEMQFLKYAEGTHLIVSTSYFQITARSSSLRSGAMSGMCSPVILDMTTTRRYPFGNGSVLS